MLFFVSRDRSVSAVITDPASIKGNAWEGIRQHAFSAIVHYSKSPLRGFLTEIPRKFGDYLHHYSIPFVLRYFKMLLIVSRFSGTSSSSSTVMEYVDSRNSTSSRTPVESIMPFSMRDWS
jgi:hypothetical protein